MNIARRYRRLNKALRLDQSAEPEAILTAAKEILTERIKHRDALHSPAAVNDYLRLVLAARDHDAFMVNRAPLSISGSDSICA